MGKATGLCAVLLATAVAVATPAAQAADDDLANKVNEMVARDEDRLVKTFKQLHANPELGFQEVKTAALVAKELRNLGYDVHTGIAKTGVVGVLKNGPGPVVMYRGDMDGLPVREETGLDYASKATSPTAGGGFTPTMHACGHDAHTTFLIGVAKVMKELKDQWSGTLVLVGQPAEELIEGATAMVKDGLYDKVPKPDYLIAPHVQAYLPVGSVGLRPGRRMAGTDQIDVTVFGVGGHGSSPHLARDPVVMGATAVLGYQTIISRVLDPQEAGVITVGSFQGGDANNVIPDFITLKVNLRWYNPMVRQQMIDGIKRVTDAAAAAADLPKDKMPKYVMKGTAGAVINDENLVRRAEAPLKAILGADRVTPGGPPVMGSEDFQNLALAHPDTKILYIEIGCGPPGVFEYALKNGALPPGVAANHNPKFKVELPAIATGTKANAIVLLDVLKKPAN